MDYTLTTKQRQFVERNAEEILKRQRKNDAQKNPLFESDAFLEGLYKAAKADINTSDETTYIMACVRNESKMLCRKRQSLKESSLEDPSLPCIDSHTNTFDVDCALKEITDNKEEAEILRLHLVERLSIRDILKIYPQRKRWATNQLINRAKERLKNIYG